MRDFIHRFGSSQNGHVHFDVGLDDWVAVDHWTSRKRVVVAVWLRCTAGPGFSPYLTLSFGGLPRREVAGFRRHSGDGQLFDLAAPEQSLKPQWLTLCTSLHIGSGFHCLIQAGNASAGIGRAMP